MFDSELDVATVCSVAESELTQESVRHNTASLRPGCWRQPEALELMYP